MSVDRYETLLQVKGALGDRPAYLGSKNQCRYCGCSDPQRFRQTAHTFPEALGNRWIISRDECDECNAKFSIYDDALANSVCPFVTLGGTQGKGNKIRQTGRSRGRSVLSRTRGASLPRISIQGAMEGAAFSYNQNTKTFRIESAIPAVPFRPRHAYKALCKMAFALLPDEELQNYKQLKTWLLDVDDHIDFPVLEVAMSFASVGNAPAVVAGTLLRRVKACDPVPHILFLFCAGSVCLQIDLRSDHLEDHIPPVPNKTIRIAWSIEFASEHGQSRTIDYAEPIHFNWSSLAVQPQPVRAIALDFCPETCAGKFTPLLRSEFLLSR